jgi:glycosyltransferase involved in cell wall biosynthesis
MNWIFLDHLDWDYDVAAPLKRPLGGSQSALCYLAAALAARGHRVTTLTGTKTPCTIDGVQCLPHDNLAVDLLSPPDTILVALNAPSDMAVGLRKLLPGAATLVLWTQLADDQPTVVALLNPACAAAWDRIVCVSDWHRSTYHRRLHVPERQMEVLRNAIGPGFERPFRDASDLAEAKSGPPRLAYTSAPFRGLDVLLSCFPEVRSTHPQCRLDVFSSLQVYYQTGVQDTLQSLYAQCRATDGVQYRGSISQASLADELRGVHLLAYPSTFAETSCIAVMEALAAGALVVTSDLGALPETCGGWAKLVPQIGAGHTREEFEREFVLQLDSALRRLESDRDAFLRERFEQAQAIQSSCTWRVRAEEWETAAIRWIQTRA